MTRVSLICRNLQVQFHEFIQNLDVFREASQPFFSHSTM